MSKQFKVAIVGATGLVGRAMLDSLAERNFPISELRLFASEKSKGKEIEFKNENIKAEVLDENSFKGIDFALFSANNAAGREFAPLAAKSGAIAIDNGSTWRMNQNVPLIVPEVNPHHLNDHHGILANPNCSTIQMVVALKPIDDNFGLKRVIVSTYQSITGAGQKGLDHLIDEINGFVPTNRITSHQVAFNTFFHQIKSEDGYSDEEIKMMKETNKIFNKEIPLTVTCVRLPILYGHGESINVETAKPIDIDKIKEIYQSADGIRFIDNPTKEEYPTVFMAKDSDLTFVGRIRKDYTIENGMNIWITANNVRKGAATNAVQIAEKIYRKRFI